MQRLFAQMTLCARRRTPTSPALAFRSAAMMFSNVICRRPTANDGQQLAGATENDRSWMIQGGGSRPSAPETSCEAFDVEHRRCGHRQVP